ncbi:MULTISPECIES: CvpA family protein [Carnobacterium]|uniref:CvpA family protein n=1 Tax=Carnobacterium antarcticum TaxID=2126436 RepID=A0ABW4NQT0_9LACT|nr:MULTISPECIES: CvpA family protein [unclassified Carnobacterium]ALV22897.1 Colicin V production protein [Carnobacterium sp. CP1]QQP70787.1 CvpA family protein [Carnobacterium sp. CS13]
MLMTIAIIVILAIGVYGGARRGLLLQLVMTVGYVAAYIVAGRYYKELGSHLELLIPYPAAAENSQFLFYNQTIGFNLDQAFYNGIAFVLILFIGWLLTRFIGGLLNSIMFIPVLKQLNTLGGAALAFAVTYVGIFLILVLLTMLPMDSVQTAFSNSSLASTIVEKTPVLSQQIYDWWIGTAA